MLLPHIAGRVFNTPLLIACAKLDIILGVVAPRLGGEALPPKLTPDPTRGYEVTPDGIAIIPIIGTLVRRTVGLEAQSGLTSYAEISQQLKQAVADASVKAILLDIDSPGGEAGGVFDLSDDIFSARSAKPIWAVANEEAYSAAYAIAAAADKIYVSRTGGVGSIGVIAVHLDQSEAEADVGLKYTAVYAGARKNDMSPHEPLSDPARATLQTEVDRIYGLFVQTVARTRNLSAESVKATEASLFFGADALTAGLADKIGTFDDALRDLTTSLVPKPPRSSFSLTRNLKRKETPMTQAEAQTQVEDDGDDLPDLETLKADFIEKTKADARAEALAYVAEVNELCALAGQSAKAMDFIAKAVPVADVRRALLTTKAVEAEVTAIVGLVTDNKVAAAEPTVDTAAIYASRNKQKGN